MGDEFETLAGSFRRDLRIRNRTDSTVRAYMESVERFSGWCRDRGLARPDDVTRDHIRVWLTTELDRVSAQTVVRHYSGIRQWFAWLAAEGEVGANPTTGIPQPAVPETLVEVPTTDSLKAVLKACDGKGYPERRDTALILVMADGGPRSAEVCGMKVEDVDLDDQVVIVMGKGRRPRGVPLGRKAVEDLATRVERLESTTNTLRAKLAAHERWARLDANDRRQATQAARQASEERWLKLAREQRPDADDAELARVAEHLRAAHFTRMALASARSRRQSRGRPE